MCIRLPQNHTKQKKYTEIFPTETPYLFCFLFLIEFRCFLVLCSLAAHWQMNNIPMAAVTNYLELGDLKQHTFILLYFMRPEARNEFSPG